MIQPLCLVYYYYCSVVKEEFSLCFSWFDNRAFLDLAGTTGKLARCFLKIIANLSVDQAAIVFFFSQ